MNAKPLIVGALLLAPAIGLAAGQAISTQPIHDATDVMDTLPDRPIISIANSATPMPPRLPDHYAMETPEGRVEVHELALRGRYADRRQHVESWRPEVEENLALIQSGRIQSGRNSNALDARAIAPEHTRIARKLQASAPEHPHQTARAEELTGEPQRAGTTPDEPATAVPEPRIANMRLIDVESELAIQR